MITQEIQDDIRSLLPDLIRFRRAIHQRPELGFQEYETTQKVKSFLEQHGIQPAYIQENLGLHFTIEGELPGDVILLRGDMDALPMQEDSYLPFHSLVPGVMHSCGHDLNTTFLLGTAVILHKHRHELPGKVKCIFQCAEETLGGAQVALNNGVLDGLFPKFGIAFHAHSDHKVGTVAFHCGPAMAASCHLHLQIEGKGGHAAYPHRTVDPVVIASHIILALQTLASRGHNPTDPLVITIGKIQGGTASNITPDHVICEGTVRYFSEELHNNLPGLLRSLCIQTAQAHGGGCLVEFTENCPAIVVPDKLYNYVADTLNTALGAKRVKKVPAPGMGSEDFAFFGELFPVMQLRIGTRFEDPRSALPLHNSNIVFSEDSIYWGILAGCSIAFAN